MTFLAFLIGYAFGVAVGMIAAVAALAWINRRAGKPGRN